MPENRMDKPRLDPSIYKQQCMWASAHAQKINIPVSILYIYECVKIDRLRLDTDKVHHGDSSPSVG